MNGRWCAKSINPYPPSCNQSHILPPISLMVPREVVLPAMNQPREIIATEKVVWTFVCRKIRSLFSDVVGYRPAGSPQVYLRSSAFLGRLAPTGGTVVVLVGARATTVRWNGGNDGPLLFNFPILRVAKGFGGLCRRRRWRWWLFANSTKRQKCTRQRPPPAVESTRKLNSFLLN